MRAYDDMQMKASVELNRMVGEWCWEIDHNAGKNATDFFTDDCMVRAGNISYQGHRAMRDFYAANAAARAAMDVERRTRHTCVNLFARFNAPSRATLRFSIVNYAGHAPFPAVGRAMPALVTDTKLECRHTAAHGWLFAELDSELLFLGDDDYLNRLLIGAA